MSAPPAIRKVSERDFQRSVIELAKTLGWKVGHFHDSRRQVRPNVFVGDKDAAGFPDLVLIRRDRLLFAELKTERGKLSPKQLEWLGLLELAEQWTYVWRPSMMDDILKVLR